MEPPLGDVDPGGGMAFRYPEYPPGPSFTLGSPCRAPAQPGAASSRTNTCTQSLARARRMEAPPFHSALRASGFPRLAGVPAPLPAIATIAWTPACAGVTDTPDSGVARPQAGFAAGNCSDRLDPCLRRGDRSAGSRSGLPVGELREWRWRLSPEASPQARAGTGCVWPREARSLLSSSPRRRGSRIDSPSC